MKNCTTIIASMLILFGCSFETKKKSEQLEFIPIEWTKNKYNNFDDGKLCMGKSVLVNNPPQNERKLIEVMMKYREEKRMPIDSLCFSYIMAFYEFTEASSVYLKQKYRNNINWNNIPFT